MKRSQFGFVCVFAVICTAIVSSLSAQNRAAHELTSVSVRDTGKELEFQCGGQQIAAYVYSHDRIWRPFFANLRTPGGITEKRGGKVSDSAGRVGARQVWSQPSAWCIYSGAIHDQKVGMVVFCHPDNFRNSWMHARDYGLIAANPFGRAAMGKGARQNRCRTRQVFAASIRPVHLRGRS